MRRGALALAALVALLGAATLATPSTRAHATAPAPRPACVSAIITHREHTEASDGITRDLSYRERFHRCQDRVWIERLRRPATAPSPRSGDRHAVPDVHTLGWLVTRAADGGATLALVDREGRRVIDVDRGSFETLRFTPRFAPAAQLVDPERLTTSRELTRPSHVTGAAWLGRDEGGRYVRFLWDSRLELALALERGEADGTTRDEVRVDLVPSPATYPWQELAAFTHVDFADFGD
jgi:hypothetical protein